ncbi:GTP-binding protein HflX [Geoalkalibacter ferrihydriticus]|uniref:GTPase HflX n=2 Tax=Geoalkalibacter ferrihydriticus TaxID=392333 RepID=A0A0C2ECT4_9BACT|nr:GTPase HflX [Geoalkalibacter ferrihydriticus]KIH76398.1 GTP-binding protein HflX [Geoalkalibacter ferrihydriticus DSM 17813]SDL92484.1 GTP-binding protein HflX [Geoalkalibacter ferrihydriticus]
MLDGNLTGLKPSQIKALERIDRRRIPPDQVVTGDLARFLTELSRDIRRQLGIIVDRQGLILHVLVGDDREILIPDLSRFGLGRSRLRGLRCIHTHLKGEALSHDDLTDLALLRLDLMVAIAVGEEGLPGRVDYAHLLPDNPEGKTVEVLSASSVYDLHLDFSQFIDSLESEMERRMGETFDLSDTREKAILISAGCEARVELEDSLNELAELARTADVVVLDRVVQRTQKVNPRFLMGEGKIREVIIRALQQGATLLIFDQDLSPGQVRSISEMTEMKVIDRTQLILDIFARRAHTLDGKVQVEVAQLKYLMPRLLGKGTVMSRLMGGIGGRGPGETKLEIDRRRIRERLSRLEKQLESLSRGRRQRRQRRIRADVPIISIVGYTNAGKSTLLNALTQSTVFTEDLLFATLDTSTRRLRFPQEREVIITDTVGFIRKLPKSLLGAFKATLEELEDADLLLHVVDISAPRFEEHIAAVERILQDLDLGDLPRLLVFNKIDRVPAGEAAALCRRFEAIGVSALDRSTFESLLEELQRRFWPQESFDDGPEKDSLL